MIIKSVELFQFQLPLKNPLQIADNRITTREGLIVKLTDDKDNIGLGEISPLPGFHNESLNQAIKQIKDFPLAQFDLNIPNKVELFFGEIESLLNRFNLFPSVQFGLDSALITLLADKTGTSTTKFFNEKPRETIIINALLTGSHSEILNKTQQYLDDGFADFKLKVGKNEIQEDINLVNAVNSIINEKAKLRLDANKAWTLNEAVFFLRNINLNNLDYIEEPLKYTHELTELLDKIAFPLALDESLTAFFDSTFLDFSKLKAIVIKPTIVGGIEESIQLIKFAEKNNILPVISDTFQSGIGLSMLIAIASQINNNIAMGFDTYSWLKDDILQKKITFVNNSINTNEILNTFNDLNYSKLKKI